MTIYILIMAFVLIYTMIFMAFSGDKFEKIIYMVIFTFSIIMLIMMIEN